MTSEEQGGRPTTAKKTEESTSLPALPPTKYIPKARVIVKEIRDDKTKIRAKNKLTGSQFHPEVKLTANSIITD